MWEIYGKAAFQAVVGIVWNEKCCRFDNKKENDQPIWQSSLRMLHFWVKQCRTIKIIVVTLFQCFVSHCFSVLFHKVQSFRLEGIVTPL